MNFHDAPLPLWLELQALDDHALGLGVALPGAGELSGQRVRVRFVCTREPAC